MPEALEALVKEWQNDVRFSQSLSAATAEAYTSDLAHFLKFLTAYTGEPPTLNSIIAIAPPDWRAWMSSQQKEGRSARTLARRLSALKNFFTFLVRKHLLADHDIFTAKTPRLPRALPHPAPYDYIQALIDACPELPGPPWVRPRDQALFLLLYGCGLRISEALSIKLSNWPQDTDFIDILGKGGKTRSVPLLPVVREAVAAYIAQRPRADSSALFLNTKLRPLSRHVVAARMRTLRRLLHLPETFSPHALRHSCATDLVQRSNNLRAVQELLGHASLSTTQIYTDVNSQYIQEAYAKAHPRATPTPNQTRKK